MILAHSLGFLIAYDTFSEQSFDGELTQGPHLVTFGSQIGHPAIRSTLGGRLVPLDRLERWYHLYNPEDCVFTADLDLPATAKFRQLLTAFDSPEFLNHDEFGYLTHQATRSGMWGHVLGVQPSTKHYSFSTHVEAMKRPTRRALLVGINDYPLPENRLSGCVNDTFLMSAALQDFGFKPEEIRVLLNERATTQGVRDRLAWLLDDVRDGDHRVLYFSGHGVQIPDYGQADEVDHVDEALVTFDFDWDTNRGITDDELFELYSQLPYSAQFIAIFDCCHSGGLTRGSSRRVRGLDPPDDIRHRMLKWDTELGRWRTRNLGPLNPSLGSDFVGASGAQARMGRALQLRGLNDEDYQRARSSKGHLGPYLPVLLQACEEKKYSYEYQHGQIAYGAFTYSLTSILRRILEQPSSPRPTPTALISQINQELEALGFDQRASVVGPSVVLQRPIPL